MDTRTKIIKSIAAVTRPDGSKYYRGYTGGNAVSLYASEKYNLNCADSSRVESDLLPELLNN